MPQHGQRRGTLRVLPFITTALLLCIHLGFGTSTALAKADYRNDDSNGGLFQSLWQSLTTAFSNVPELPNASEPKSPLPHNQDNAINRRLLLMQRTLHEHYAQHLFESSQTGNESFYQLHPGRQLNRNPLRWVELLDDKVCHFFRENTSSHWSFQWCPHGAIYQGIQRTPKGTFERHHHLGSFTKWDAGDTFQDGDIPIKLANRVQEKFPTANVELYQNGDTCRGGPRHGKSSHNRTSVVVFHNAASRYCAGAWTNELDHQQAIESVEEVQICKYIIHVCQSSEKDSNGSSDHSDPIAESETLRLKQRLAQIQEVIQVYLHQTTAEAYEQSNPDRTTSLHIGLPPLPTSRVTANLELVKDMFMHSYDSYMYSAFPASEVKPLTCEPAQFHLVRIPALTLIDSLDTLVVLGNYTEFARAVERLRELHVFMREENGVLGNGGLFGLNQNVSVFETNIRVLGGLLSAHQLAEAFLPNVVLEEDVWDSDKAILIGEQPTEDTCPPRQSEATNQFPGECEAEVLSESTASNDETDGQNITKKFWEYDGFLLELAQDIGDRLLPAFSTKTGIPYGTVNLLSGIPEGETTIASLAGGGTLSLEMELLSRLTGNSEYGRAAKLASRALWMRRTPSNMVGKHICTEKGEWTESLSGIGSNSDSFYEYLIKHHTLFPEDSDFWIQMVSSYGGVHNESRLGEWYGDVDSFVGPSSGGGARRVLEALMAFYPGMQVLLGEITPAARSLNSFLLVREHLGFLPERFNFGNWRVDTAGGKHFLRPELLESVYFLHRATKGVQQQLRNRATEANDSSGWLWAADFALHTLEKSTRAKCGYASLKDLSPTTTGSLGRQGEGSLKLMNDMPSFFLSETLKYLYLTFDEGNILHTDPDHQWVFTTEAHPIHHASPAKEEKHRMLELKNSLIQRLSSRIEGKKTFRRLELWSLEDEKWTKSSPFQSYVQQIMPLGGSLQPAGASQPGSTSAKGQGLHFAHVEPFLMAEQVFVELDYFGETQERKNPAHLSFARMGRGRMLSASCPNLYLSDYTWIRALNGGTTDYAQAYISTVNDAPTPGESRFLMLGSMDALALQGSGVHVLELYGMSRRFPIFSQEKKKAAAQATKGQSSGNNGLDRFNMGGELGSFDVSAFPGGSGFFIQHVESGEKVVTTLIDDESRAGPLGTYVMVYASGATKDASSQDTSQKGSKPDSGHPLEDEGDSDSPENTDSPHPRSVVIADLKGNSFSCEVQLVVTSAENDFGSKDPAIEQLVAAYPCAPALFGPSHVSKLIGSGGVTIEAGIHVPDSGKDYGCKDSKEENPKATSLLLPQEKDLPPTSVPLGPSDMGGDDDSDSQQAEGTCSNRFVHLIHRGVCTFQEKSLHQRDAFDAAAVIVVNSDEDELFVMSGGGPESHDNRGSDSYPVTVLVTGLDGKRIIDAANSFVPNAETDLRVRVSLMPGEGKISQQGNVFAVQESNYWPIVQASEESIQVIVKGGWGVHGTQRSPQAQSAQPEWQLYVMRYELPDPLVADPTLVPVDAQEDDT